MVKNAQHRRSVPWVAVATTIVDHPVVGITVAQPAVADLRRPFAAPIGAWLDLLTRAAYGPTTVVDGGRTVELARGQCVLARTTAAARWNWTEAAVRQFFDRLCDHDMVSWDPGSGRYARIITIRNYDRFQHRRQPAAQPVVGPTADAVTGCSDDENRSCEPAAQPAAQPVHNRFNSRLVAESQPVAQPVGGDATGCFYDEKTAPEPAAQPVQQPVAGRPTAGSTATTHRVIETDRKHTHTVARARRWGGRFNDVVGTLAPPVAAALRNLCGGRGPDGDPDVLLPAIAAVLADVPPAHLPAVVERVRAVRTDVFGDGHVRTAIAAVVPPPARPSSTAAATTWRIDRRTVAPVVWSAWCRALTAEQRAAAERDDAFYATTLRAHDAGAAYVGPAPQPQPQAAPSLRVVTGGAA